jgi:hypothetical protein
MLWENFSKIVLRVGSPLDMISSVTNFNCLAQLLIVNCGIVAQTLNVNLTLFVIPCKFWRDSGCIVLQLLSLTK